MERRRLVTSILCLSLAACGGQGGFHTPIATVQTEAKSTYTPPKIEMTDLSGNPVTPEYKGTPVAQGGTQVNGVKISIDGPTQKTKVQGTLILSPSDAAGPVTIPLDLEGTITDSYKAYLQPTNKSLLEQSQLKVAAKLTCLYSDCSDSFVDIYVHYKGILYHHQVHSVTQQAPAKPTTPVGPSFDDQKQPSQPAQPAKPQTPGKENPATPATPKVETPKIPDPNLSGDGDDDDEPENDVAGEADEGYFVGDREGDIEVLFPELKKPEAQPPLKKDVPASPAPSKQPAPTKPAEPKRDEPKPKVDTPPAKQDPPKKDVEPTPDTPKAEAPKAGTPVIIQAVRGVNNGVLQNAADLLAYEKEHSPTGFHILRPERLTYFSTNEMLMTIAHMGQYSLKYVDNYVLSIGDVSKKTGGALGKHLSHRTGMDADISYYFDNKNLQSGFTNALAAATKPRTEWNTEDQWKLFKYVVNSNNIDRIFVHPVLKKSLCDFAVKDGELRANQKDGLVWETLRRLSPDSGHANHFHLRLKCASIQAKEARERCFQAPEPVKDSGCKF